MPNWNHEALDAAVEWCGEIGTRQLVITDHGETVVERYWGRSTAETQFEVGSIQKLLTSVAIGTLVADGLVDIHAPMQEWLGDGWSQTTPDQEARVLLRHMLSMTSGLFDDLTFETEPDRLWYYNSLGYHQVRKLVEAVTGQPASAAFAARILDVADMDHSQFEERETTDHTGWHHAGLWTTARDLEAFATTLIDGGFGIDAGYAKAMTEPAQDLNPAYGLLWWNYDATHVLTPGLLRDRDAEPGHSFSTIELDRRIAPSAPSGMIGGTGMGEQRLFIIPEREIVVVRLGKLPSSGGPFDEALWSRLSPALP